jgi:hypothetical protein
MGDGGWRTCYERQTQTLASADGEVKLLSTIIRLETSQPSIHNLSRILSSFTPTSLVLPRLHRYRNREKGLAVRKPRQQLQETVSHKDGAASGVPAVENKVHPLAVRVVWIAPFGEA